jgi:CRISPR system Cascade subunit CasB
MKTESLDFPALRARYEGLPTGAQAELRRVAEPDDLGLTTALYRLFPGERPSERHLRLAFLLPWCPQRASTKPLGAQLAAAKVSEARVLQTVRSHEPLDIVQLRRLVMHIEPVDWTDFGRMVWFWEPKDKRKLVEDFYIARFTPAKGDKK